MNLRSVLIIIAASLFIYSCKSADSQVPAISTDMCNCFKTIEESMKPEVRAIFEEVAKSDDPQSKLMEGMKTLTPELANELGEQLSSVGRNTSPIGKCMKELEKKYDKLYTKDKDGVMQKVVKELSSKDGCNVSAALLSIGIKAKKK